jgi:hypothetical protein
MSNYMGGSAYAMARDIAEGFIQVSERTYKKMTDAEMRKLSHELDRHMRELRGEAVSPEETPVLQARQRKIIRLRNALTVMRAFQSKTRRPS